MAEKAAEFKATGNEIITGICLRVLNSIIKTMTIYSEDELEEALRAIDSIIGKCEKALPKLKENSAQRTLLERRIKALQISVELIKRELSR